jgi:hypothetical protein
MDKWQSLRDRLSAGPTQEDNVYVYSSGELKGQIAMWTLNEVRSDYLEALLKERDDLEMLAREADLLPKLP